MAIYGEVIDGRAYASVEGFVIREPEDRVISDKLSILSFAISTSSKIPSYIPKGALDAFGDSIEEIKASGKNYYADSIVNVDLKFDERDKFKGTFGKGSRVKVVGAIGERAYRRKDGTLGRSLEVVYVADFAVIDAGEQFESAPSEAVSSDPFAGVF